jgi:hypothetical protein
MLASFLANMILGSGRWTVGRNLVQMVRIRVAALNGCPFRMDINAAVGGKAAGLWHARISPRSRSGKE